MTVLDFRPKLKEVALTLKEENKMPLTITREMIEKDPFFRKGKEEGLKEGVEEAYKKNIIKLYTKKSFTPGEIAEVLDISVDVVIKTLEERGYKVK